MMVSLLQLGAEGSEEALTLIQQDTGPFQRQVSSGFSRFYASATFLVQENII